MAKIIVTGPTKKFLRHVLKHLPLFKDVTITLDDYALGSFDGIAGLHVKKVK